MIRNTISAIRDQLPWSRLWRNVRNGSIRGWIDKRSHLTHRGEPKVSYGSKASAIKAAEKMESKTGFVFSNYKCLYCNGYHIGKSSIKKAPLN